jgi:hypothetical protein
MLRPMLRSLSTILLAANVAVLGNVAVLDTTQSSAAELCKPRLSLEQARLSEIKNQERKWSAMLDADASRCATTSGSFAINFTRLKETAPDLPFSEQFTWKPGRTEIVMFVWQDEALADSAIGYVAACPCRNAVGQAQAR